MLNKATISSIKNVASSFSRKIIITCFFASVIYVLLSLPTIWDFFVHEQVLSVYTFSEFFTPESIQEFEKETGIKVYVRYFETNEELFAKFKISEGEGYDIITPSDFMVELLHREGLLSKLDHAKLPCIKDLDEKLLNAFYDPQNQYSVPLEWAVYGIVYKKNIWKKPPNPSLNLLFDSPAKNATFNYKICMLDDARVSILLASTFLFGKVENITDKEYEKISELLKNQKHWVECYTDYGSQYFLFADIVPIAISSSAYVRKIFKSSDKFAFFIPKEGSVMALENLAIPKRSKKIELAYKFINFMLSRKMSSLNSNTYGHLPSNKKSYLDIEKCFLDDPNFFPTEEVFSKLHLTRNDVSLKKVETIWLNVKFAK